MKFDSSAWSRLHSTIANPLDFRPLASENTIVLSEGEMFLDGIFQEIIQEQITRVLLERLIVNRPHPWGLLITFIELIKEVVIMHWACAKIIASLAIPDITLHEILLDKLVAHADKSGRRKLAAMLVEHEPRSSNHFVRDFDRCLKFLYY
ncbi:Protein VACUOLELESS1 [Camellia lanceoleosa]|uniref:Protein VACUOLELESS1 n=1 Tax=Camellia lanceoleosa TaxID=1840588 RepID=A0ACC0FQ08_9ERIC|nr:Protein VACUOLELESS1 [Camellia lanceoleosa]